MFAKGPGVIFVEKCSGGMLLLFGDGNSSIGDMSAKKLGIACMKRMCYDWFVTMNKGLRGEHLDFLISLVGKNCSKFECFASDFQIFSSLETSIIVTHLMKVVLIQYETLAYEFGVHRTRK